MIRASSWKNSTPLFAILKPGGSTVLTTAFYSIANSATGQMRYVNAGHPKPFLLRRAEGQVEEIKSHQLKSRAALGLFENFNYQTSNSNSPRTIWCCCSPTDSTEVHAPTKIYTREMLFGDPRHLKLPVARLFDALLKEVQDFAGKTTFEDDVCIVGMEFQDSSNGNAR